MKIFNCNSLPYINNINYKGFVNNKITKPLTCDTFEKTNDKKISFGCSNNDFASFEIWAAETDFLAKIGDIADKYGKILGSGFEGTTYEIPDNDLWVIKEPKRGNIINLATEKPIISKIHDEAPEINIGQIIARVTLPLGKSNSRMFYILKRQTGRTYGVAYADQNDVSEHNINRHLKSLKTVSELPISSYKQVIEDVLYVNSKGYRLDCANSNNIMIDEDKQQINFVDVEIDSTKSKPSQLGDVLYGLLDSSFGINFLKAGTDFESKFEAKKYSDTIINKFLQAMRESNAKFADTNLIQVVLESSLLDSFIEAQNGQRTLEQLNKLVTG